MDSGVVGRGLGRVETGMLAEMAFQVSPWFASSLPGPATANGFTSTCRPVSWTTAVLPPIFGFVKRYSVGFGANDLQLQDGIGERATPGLRFESANAEHCRLSRGERRSVEIGGFAMDAVSIGQGCRAAAGAWRGLGVGPLDDVLLAIAGCRVGPAQVRYPQWLFPAYAMKREFFGLAKSTSAFAAV